MRDVDIKISVDEDLEEEVVDEPQNSPKSSYIKEKMPLIGRISSLIFLLTVLLTPIIFVPQSLGLQLEFAKRAVLSIGLLTSLVLWLITRIEDGMVVFPGGFVFFASALVLLSFFLSSIFSPAVGLSLFGLGYEADTFISVAILFLAMFLSGIFFESKKNLSRFFYGMLAVFLITGVYELAQLLSPVKFLSGGMLANLIGKWNDLGIFFGLALIVSLIGLELPNFSAGKSRIFFWLLLVLSFLIVGTVNYNLIWIIIGSFALLILIYSLAANGLISSDKQTSFKRVVFRPAFIVLLLSIVLFFSSNIVGSFLGKYGIFQLEVRPSWQSTAAVATVAMQSNRYFGAGPNRFSAVWATSRPVEVNSTVFWSTDFNSGFGRIPSYAVTLGLFGILSWVIFLLAIIYYVFKAALSSLDEGGDPSGRFALLASGLAALYLWTFSIFYVVDSSLLALTFVSTGIFLAVLASSGIIKNHQVSWRGFPRLGFLSVLAVIILIIATISVTFLLSKKFLAMYDFQRGLYIMNGSGNSDQALARITTAATLDEQDLYYRTLTEIYLIRIRNILGSQPQVPKETILKNLQDNLTGAAGSARRATDLNPENYQNWMTLGGVGETMLPLKDVVSGSYDLAFNSYVKALSLNKNDPRIDLRLANIALSSGDPSRAEEYLGQALAKKGNFTDALSLLSQIEASRGNLPSAIRQIDQALVFSPDDVSLLFQSGFLKYTDKDYIGAAGSLSRLVSIQPNYSNAKYFLGLSLSKLGRQSEAIAQFEDIAVLNPDSQEVKNILTNLREGRSALAPAAAEKVAPKKNARSK